MSFQSEANSTYVNGSSVAKSDVRALWGDVDDVVTTLNRLGVIPLTNIGGTANAITADMTSGTPVASLNANSTVSFTPSASNTASPVTLFVAGDQARLLRGEDGGDIPVGYLKASRFYIAQRFGANWKIISGGATFDDLTTITSTIAAALNVVGVTPLINVAGTGNAITADMAANAVAAGMVIGGNALVEFIPVETNTNPSPTLLVSQDGTARFIQPEDGESMPAEFLVPGRSYLLRRRGNVWRVQSGSATKLMLDALRAVLETASNLGDVLRLTTSGTADAMTATRPAGQSHIGDTLGTVVSFSPVGTNTVPNPTLQIEGGPVREIRRAQGGELPAGALNPNRFYLARITGGTPQTLGLLESVLPQDIVGLQATLNSLQTGLEGKAPLAHLHPLGQVEGLTSALNGKAPVAATWDFAGHFTGSNIIASHSGNNIWIGWAGMSIRRSNGLFWSISDRVPALLPLNGVLYFETAGSGNPLPVLQGTANAAFAERVTAGEVVVLLQVGLGRLSGMMASAVEQVLATRIAASLGVPAVSSAIAQTAAMSESWDTGSTVISIGTSGWYACQPVIRDRVISITNSAATVDLEYLPLGRTVAISAPSGCNVFAGDTSVFVGQPGQRHAQFVGDTVFRATRVGALRVLLEPVAGAAPTYSVIARPAMGRTIILAGQSQNAIGATRGLIGGFTDEMMTAGITGQADLASNYFVRAAVSGSSATRTATANYWWDDQNDEAGPLLLAAAAAVQAAIDVGQPAPEWLIWRQGEGDARSIETGALTGAAYKAATQSIWLHFRTLWPDIKVIASPPGASDTPISKRGMAAIRQAYFELTEDLPWAHYGHEMYDVPRNYGNVHPTDDGYYIMGIRDAILMQAIDGSAETNLGPAVLSAVRNADGTVTVEIGNAPSDGFPPAAARDDGPSPYGLSLIVGDPGAVDPVPVAYGSCVETGTGAAKKLWITLYPLASTAGAYLHTVATQAEHAYRRTYPIRLLQHGKSPGLPMRFQRVQVTG